MEHVRCRSYNTSALGERGLSRADKRGSSDADVQTFLQKTSDFSKIMVCRQLQTRGEGTTFREFVRTSFINGQLAGY